MKKIYKIKINNDPKTDSISGILGLSREKMTALMNRFADRLEAITIKHPEFQLADMFQAGVDVAENDTELAYVFFRIGKQHEQVNMEQAATFAEKVIIPGLVSKIANGKKILN